MASPRKYEICTPKLLEVPQALKLYGIDYFHTIVIKTDMTLRKNGKNHCKGAGKNVSRRKRLE